MAVSLNVDEQTLILAETFLGGEVAARVRAALMSGPTRTVRLTLNDLDELIGHVAAAANHARRAATAKALDRLYGRLRRVEEAYTDDEAEW